MPEIASNTGLHRLQLLRSPSKNTLPQQPPRKTRALILHHQTRAPRFVTVRHTRFVAYRMTNLASAKSVLQTGALPAAPSLRKYHATARSTRMIVCDVRIQAPPSANHTVRSAVGDAAHVFSPRRRILQKVPTHLIDCVLQFHEAQRFLNLRRDFSCGIFAAAGTLHFPQRSSESNKSASGTKSNLAGESPVAPFLSSRICACPPPKTLTSPASGFSSPAAISSLVSSRCPFLPTTPRSLWETLLTKDRARWSPS